MFFYVINRVLFPKIRDFKYLYLRIFVIIAIIDSFVLGGSSVQYAGDNVIKSNLFRRMVARYYKIMKRNQFPDISPKYEDLEMEVVPQDEKADDKNYNKGIYIINFYDQV